MDLTRQLTEQNSMLIIELLHKRFTKNMHRHKGVEWLEVVDRLRSNPEKLWSIHQMEITGGEPDVIGYNTENKCFIYCDCSAESPSGRRSLCYDEAALAARKEFKPVNNAVDMAHNMGILLLTEQQYVLLQALEKFDTKTSSWLLTPEAVRKLGGAIFGDCRYDRVFIYHNGAQSYYAARGFRGYIEI